MTHKEIIFTFDLDGKIAMCIFQGKWKQAQIQIAEAQSRLDAADLNKKAAVIEAWKQLEGGMYED
jgi:hypothetical protein